MFKPRFRSRARLAVASPRLSSNQRSPWAWAGAGALLGLLVSTLVFAPARWISSLVQRASAGQVLLDDARGTVWTGSARLTLTGGSGSPDRSTLPGRLTWQLRPAATGASGLNLQLGADCCLSQAWLWRLSPRWDGLHLTFSDHQSHWPAQWLVGLGTPWNTLQMQGQLVLGTQAMSLHWASGRWQVAGSAQLEAQDLSSRLSTIRPMGSYRLTLSGGAAPDLQLVTLVGSLQLSGQGQWVGNKLRFRGEASAAPESQAALSNLLNIIGRRNGARSTINLG